MSSQKASKDIVYQLKLTLRAVNPHLETPAGLRRDFPAGLPPDHPGGDGLDEQPSAPIHHS